MRRLFSATVLTAAAVARAEHGLEVHSAALQAEGDGPGRLIVLSHGRGGSTVLGSALAELAHSDQNAMVKELFGENALQMRNVTNPTESMASWFDHQRARQPHARLVGFKWKPSVDSEAYSAAWDWVAAQGVSVVYMTRNELDEIISAEKHAADASHELGSHCAMDNTTCIEAHRRQRIRLDGAQVVASLDEREASAADLRTLLRSKHIRYHHARFEDLFAGEPTARHRDTHRALAAWNRVLAFLGEPAATRYEEIAQAIASTHLAQTSAPTQCEQLTNVDEVRHALKGTPYAALLEC